jgi:hypothetical protein
MIPAILAALSLAAPVQSADLPALISNPTPESRASLLQAVRSALNGAPVTLADDALTRESTLLIERAIRRDAARLRMQGREVSPPERFQLVKSGGACVLVHERTGRRFTLEHTSCVELG